MRKVEVVAYDRNWPGLFEQERWRLEKIFGSVLVEVHHIGSTAVPGLAAKPVIDLLPVVSDLTAVDAVTAEMVEAGYEAKGENGLPGRRFFKRVGRTELITSTYLKQGALKSNVISCSGIICVHMTRSGVLMVG